MCTPHFEIQNGVLAKCMMSGEENVTVTIPDGETSIGKDTFFDCGLLQSITIPDSVISIGNKAFARCTALENITIPNSVTSVGCDAFRWCVLLESIIIPESVPSIGKGALFLCESLKSITIPENVTSDEVTVTVKVNPIAMKMWALKYSRHIRVIFPQSLVDEIKADIDFAKKNYE